LRISRFTNHPALPTKTFSIKAFFLFANHEESCRVAGVPRGIFGFAPI
jgi:hypothetical protein